MDDNIRLSLGSAAALDLKKSKTSCKTNTIYLMNSGGCQFNCSFCSQAKGASSRQDKLSRVTWPEYKSQDVLTALKKNESQYKRICMQVVNTMDVFTSLPHTVRQLRETAPDTKIAMTIRTYSMPVVDAMFAAGADQVGLSIDAIDPDQFTKIKGGSFEFYKKFILQAADKYPGQIATHLIIGMGESEQQAVELMKELHDHQIIIALFAFTPVRGAQMEFNEPPDISSYRRIQVALHLIRNNLDQGFTYDDQGRITNFGYPKNELSEIIKNSPTFETSGCSDCNRPYYNERAHSKDLYNYPYKLKSEQFSEIFQSIYLYN